MKRFFTAAALLAGAACVSPAPPALKPGERPARETDEAGLWMQAERAETAIRTSSLAVTDPALNAYVCGIASRVAGPHAKDIRVYILRAPEFGAFLFPNGAMVVLTGLLLRAQSEAQIAYVVGHEIGHYLHRHGVQLFRDVRSKAGFAAFFQTFTRAAAMGEVGALGSLMALGSVMGFSRENEREADQIGFELMVKAGYEANEARRVWDGLLKEHAAAGREEPGVFMATHPAPRERLEALERLVAERAAPAGEVGRERHLAAILPWLGAYLADELKRKNPGGTQVLLDRLSETRARPGQLGFFQGEVYRLRGKDGDAERAIAAYRKALEAPDVPPETCRALGLLYLKGGDKANARACLRDYLEKCPRAEDRDMVGSYLRKLDQE